MVIHGSKEWRTETYKQLVYRKKHKMWRSLGFGMLCSVYGRDDARWLMKEATDDQLQEWMTAYGKALVERDECD